MNVHDLLNTPARATAEIRTEPLSQGARAAPATPPAQAQAPPQAARVTPAGSVGLERAGMIKIKKEEPQEESGMAGHPAQPPGRPALFPVPLPSGPPPGPAPPLRSIPQLRNAREVPGPPANMLYTIHTLTNIGAYPCPSYPGSVVYSVIIPRPKPFYSPELCRGFTGGPSLMAFHCLMLHKKNSRATVRGRTYLDLAYDFHNAERGEQDECVGGWVSEPTKDVLGIASERLAWRVVGVLLSSTGDLSQVRHFVNEVEEAITCLNRRWTHPTDLETGFHGTLSMLRVMCQFVDAARESTSRLAGRLVLCLADVTPLGHSPLSPIIKSEDRPSTPEIACTIDSLEDDIGTLTEMALLRPDAARRRSVGITHENGLADILTEQLLSNLNRFAGGDLALRVSYFSANAMMNRGPWYITACLLHLIKFLESVPEYENLKQRLQYALFIC